MAQSIQPTEHLLPGGKALTLREATSDDAPAVLEYIERVSAESNFLCFGPGEFELSEAEERKVLRVFCESKNQLYLLGLVENKIVGSLHFAAGGHSRNLHVGEFGMTVRKDYWGKGIGNLLLDALIQWAKGTGSLRKINLRVRTDNVRAIQLYERKGFVNEGTLQNEILLDGTFYDHHCMGLSW